MDWRSRIIEQVDLPVGYLTANPQNWRKHPRAQGEALAGTLAEVGVVQGVIYNRRTERLVDGHLRVELARKQGVATLPVTVVDLSEDEERLVLATLDPIGAMATHDDDQLRSLLSSIAAQQDRAVASVLDDLARRVPKSKPKEREGDEQSPLEQVAAKWNVQPGDLWTIPSIATSGKSHRILCGDSTKEEDVRRLMCDERAVLFATDPPYAIGYDGKKDHGFAGPCAGKDWSKFYFEHESAGDMYAAVFRSAVDVALATGAPWYCWHSSRNQVALETAWVAIEAFVHQQIVWVKPSPVFARAIYGQSHEPCLFGWVKGNDPRNTEGSPNMFRNGRKPTTVWEFPAPNNRGLHPTMKPVELFEIPMEMHTLQGELCYEPFAGSGTQLVAAERMGRICYAMELQPAFVAVALERLSGLGLHPERTDAPADGQPDPGVIHG